MVEPRPPAGDQRCVPNSLPVPASCPEFVFLFFQPSSLRHAILGQSALKKYQEHEHWRSKLTHCTADCRTRWASANFWAASFSAAAWATAAAFKSKRNDVRILPRTTIEWLQQTCWRLNSFSSSSRRCCCLIFTWCSNIWCGEQYHQTHENCKQQSKQSHLEVIITFKKWLESSELLQCCKV